MHLVVGATGSLGGRITRALLARNEAVRVLVRPHSDYSDLEQAGAQAVEGDLKDAQSVRAALNGVTSVITTANSAQRGGTDNVETVDTAGTATLIDEAAAVGVGRFLYLSAIAADENSPVPFFRAKAVSEQRLRGSGLEYTIIKPVLFMENWIGLFLSAQLAQGPKVQLVGDGHKKAAFVSVADVATLAANAVAHPAARNEEIPVSAVAASYREIIAELERLSGDRIEVETLEPGASIDRLPPGLRESLSPLMAGLALGPETDFTTPEVAEQYGLRFTELGDYLKGALSEMKKPA